MTRRTVGICFFTAVVGVTIGACTSATPPGATPSGSYPVATLPASIAAIPTVATGGYQLVAAGDPVDATVPGARVRIVAQGPDVAVRYGPNGTIDHEHAEGALTVQIDVISGHLTIPATSFLTLDEKQDPVRTTSLPESLDLGAGQRGSLAVRAVFDAGHTTLTWQPVGKPLITWDFTIELD